MYVCVRCKQEMDCDKNEVGFAWGPYVYAGDRFKCSTCGFEILATNDGGSYDPERKMSGEYLTRKESDNVPTEEKA